MKRLSVPCIFAPELVPFYAQQNQSFKHFDICIAEAYGSLPYWSARERKRLPVIKKKELETYVKKLRDIGIGFNYCLNSTVITPQDIEIGGVREFIAWLIESVGVRTITVASPILAYDIVHHFPSVDIVLSTICNVESFSHILQSAEMKVKRVNLTLRASRDFGFLRAVKQWKANSGTDFELLVNEFCGDCLLRNTHYNLESLNACAYQAEDNFLCDYPFNLCTPRFMGSISAVLKNYWILPEWLTVYEEHGVEWFKITGRTIKDIEWHKKVINAYMTQEFEGNVLDLGPLVVGSLNDEGTPSPIYLEAASVKKSAYLQHFQEITRPCATQCGISCQFCEQLSDYITRQNSVSDNYFSTNQAVNTNMGRIITPQTRFWTGNQKRER